MTTIRYENYKKLSYKEYINKPKKGSAIILPIPQGTHGIEKNIQLYTLEDSAGKKIGKGSASTLRLIYNYSCAVSDIFSSSLLPTTALWQNNIGTPNPQIDAAFPLLNNCLKTQFGDRKCGADSRENSCKFC